MPPVKYWEIIADKLPLPAGHGAIAVPLQRMAGAGFVDAHRDGGRRYIVQPDELLTAFLQ